LQLAVHLILDNYATHKTPAVRRWLARHPRFHVHFTPTYASWINLVESWFAVLTNRRLRRGNFTSSRQLEAVVTAVSPSTTCCTTCFVSRAGAEPTVGRTSSCATRKASGAFLVFSRQAELDLGAWLLAQTMPYHSA
jgi:hypothetical protein